MFDPDIIIQKGNNCNNCYHVNVCAHKDKAKDIADKISIIIREVEYPFGAIVTCDFYQKKGPNYRSFTGVSNTDI